MSQTIIKLKAGSQAPPVCTGLSNITYVPDGSGQVIFTSQIKLGNTTNIIFDARGQLPFGHTGSDFAVFGPGNGNNIGFQFWNWDFTNSKSKVIIDASTKIFINNVILSFDGTPKTTVYWDLTGDTLKIPGGIQLLAGTYEPMTSYRMFVVAPKFSNCTFANVATGSNIKIQNNGIIGLKVNNWKLTGPTTNTSDCGIIWITGSVEARNIYRDAGWGYIKRLWISLLPSIPFDQKCGIYNTIDVRSTHYGTVDVRNDPAGLRSTAAIAITGGDYEFMNNDSGDKVDGPDSANTNPDGGAGHYVTNAVVLGAMVDDLGVAHKITIRNNIAWNADVRSGMAGGSSLFKGNAATNQYVMDSGNNIDLPPGVPIPAGYFQDMTLFVPVKGGPLDGTNIGAVQTPTTPPIPPNPEVGPPGPAGPQGPQGVPGKDGAPGKDGRGVVSMTILYTDGTTQVLQ